MSYDHKFLKYPKITSQEVFVVKVLTTVKVNYCNGDREIFLVLVCVFSLKFEANL